VLSLESSVTISPKLAAFTPQSTHTFTSIISLRTLKKGGLLLHRSHKVSMVLLVSTAKPMPKSAGTAFAVINGA